MTQDPTKQVYWIIVSDEGTSTKPRRHESYDSAYNESVRLSKLHPGLNFVVFKSVGKTFTPKPAEVKTTYEQFTEPTPESEWSYKYKYPNLAYLRTWC